MCLLWWNVLSGLLYFRYTCKIFWPLSCMDVGLGLQRDRKKVSWSCLGPWGGLATGNWRELPSEKMCDVCSSWNIMRMTKSGRRKWAGNVTRMGWKRNGYVVLWTHEKKKNKFSLRLYCWRCRIHLQQVVMLRCCARRRDGALERLRGDVIDLSYKPPNITKP